MRTTTHKREAGTDAAGCDEPAVDPEALWLDPDVPAELLVRLDPLDISPEMVAWAESPEEGDFVLSHLPERGFSLEGEAEERRLMRFGYAVRRDGVGRG